MQNRFTVLNSLQDCSLPIQADLCYKGRECVCDTFVSYGAEEREDWIIKIERPLINSRVGQRRDSVMKIALKIIR